jgi:DTW domain-containing protein YfiP
MLAGLCVCALLPRPPLMTRARLLLVMHKDEARKPTNTGRLAAACLASAVTLVRGEGEEIDVGPLLGARPVLLFPDPAAVPLDRLLAAAARDDDRLAEPITLIVPDGNWRQAQRVRTRVPGLAAVPCAVLPPGPPTAYRLRHEPRPGGLATAEAIARAFGVLEGADVEAAILRPFRAMVERTLWARGALATADVTDGIPAGVTRASRHGLMTPRDPDHA